MATTESMTATAMVGDHVGVMGGQLPPGMRTSSLPFPARGKEGEEQRRQRRVTTARTLTGTPKATVKAESPTNGNKKGK